MLLLCFSLIILLLFFMTIEVKRLKLSKKFKHIPGVREWPIIGNGFILRVNSITEPAIVFKAFNFDKITKIFVGSKMIIFVSDPEVLQAITTGSNFTERPFFAKFFRFPYGLITAQYKNWKPIRKAVNPAFSQRVSLSFLPIFNKYYSNFCHEIQELNGQTFDINEISIRIGMKVILETNFGYKDEENEFQTDIFEKYLENVCFRHVNPWIYPDFLYRRTNLAKEDQKIDETFKKMFRKVLKNRMIRDENHRIFIDEMLKYLEESKFPNDDPLIQNMATIFMAGYETAAVTLSMTILLLALHPEVDEKVAKELFEHYKPGDEIDQELIRKLSYLDKVLKESMRLFPAAPITARENIEPTFVKKLGNLEKGTIVGLSLYNLHRWKDIWGENADKFDPDEHFSDENVAKRHPYAYLPFSGGPKICIGYQYAMVNVKVGLIKILSQFKFSSKLKMEDFNFKISVTMKLLNGYLVQAHPRK